MSAGPAISELLARLESLESQAQSERDERDELKHLLAEAIGHIAWMAQAQHQAHHGPTERTWNECSRPADSRSSWMAECSRSTCVSSARVLERLQRGLRGVR